QVVQTYLADYVDSYVTHRIHDIFFALYVNLF
ncbi:hypothetical protein TNCT_351401, partial [Trichonephila clavata]